ncbi:glycosyltransferase [Parapedobacter tibetensis]|uniref:glycosyltransferase n=1 Tax=Parapedobacter tibetensis TaxID=2972951 RepID=UPI00214D1B60|nr:nucleotide disphospho-sugar-binding domain-containing protein [Parapedobacter tibetensis]
MAKFAFTVPPFTGHVNPTLSIGAELLRRGHEVAWISLDESLPAQLPVGGKSLLVQEAGSLVTQHDQSDYQNHITQNHFTGIESVKFLYEDVLMPLNRYMFKGIVGCLNAFQPDVVIHDHELFAGAFAANLLDIQYATLVTAPAAIRLKYDLPGVYAWEHKQVLALQRELGLLSSADITLSPQLVLITSIAAFFGDMALPPHYRFTGPVMQHRRSLAPFDWKRFETMEPGAPRVLVSIGTTFDHAYKKEFFAKVVTAFAGQPMQVVVVTDPKLFTEWPPNFMVCEKIPQVELLPHLDAVVCHGGQNTVCESLANGLPLVVIPIAYDQSYVAGRVVETGCGIRLNYKRFKSQHLKDAVETVLLDDTYRQKAATIQKAFAGLGGTDDAASRLEELSQSGGYRTKADKKPFEVTHKG